MQIDGAAVLFSVSLAVAAGLVFGIVPALQTSTRNQSAALTDAGRGSSVGKSGAWVREALVVSEMALAYVLLIGSGRLRRSFFAVLDVDLGFREQGAVAWRVDTAREFESGPERIAYFQNIARSAAAVPGIEDVGFSDTLPRLVDPGYLQAMRIPLASSRYFEPSDDLNSELAIIINGTAARSLFPDVRDRSTASYVSRAKSFASSASFPTFGTAPSKKHRATRCTSSSRSSLSGGARWSSSRERPCPSGVSHRAHESAELVGPSSFAVRLSTLPFRN